jgi:DNA repair protein RadA/Sms
MIILDSINAVRSGSSLSPPGSPSNITKTLNMLHHLRLKKEVTITQIIIAHANKQRTVAGPLTLQHMVDIVLFFNIEKDGKRTITTLKNRFGPSNIKTTFNF